MAINKRYSNDPQWELALSQGQGKTTSCVFQVQALQWLAQISEQGASAAHLSQEGPPRRTVPLGGRIPYSLMGRLPSWGRGPPPPHQKIPATGQQDLLSLTG